MAKKKEARIIKEIECRSERWHFQSNDNCLIIKLLDGGEWKIPSLMVGVKGIVKLAEETTEAWDNYDNKVMETVKREELEEVVQLAVSQAGDERANHELIKDDIMQAVDIFNQKKSTSIIDALKISSRLIYKHLTNEYGGYLEDKITADEFFAINTRQTIIAGYNWIVASQTPKETKKQNEAMLLQIEATSIEASNRAKQNAITQDVIMEAQAKNAQSVKVE